MLVSKYWVFFLQLSRFKVELSLAEFESFPITSKKQRFTLLLLLSLHAQLCLYHLYHVLIVLLRQRKLPSLKKQGYEKT